jgi:dTDP-4-amino-4,6-dideoxygalactose transaminase
MVPHNRLTFDEAEASAVAAAVMSGRWAGGPAVKRLEQRLGCILGRTNTFAVSSGLEALRIALIACDVKAGDAVLVPAYTCSALANAVLALGAVPVPIDIKDDLSIDPQKGLEQAEKSNAHTVIAVHTFGQPAELQPFLEAGLKVVEDCAHGFGSDLPNGRMGALGTLSIFSFYATKLIGGGEGGAICTDDPELARRVEDLRDYTDKTPSGLRLNSKMSDIHAALSDVQLSRLSDFIAARRSIAEGYLRAFSSLEEQGMLRLPCNSPGRIWYRFPLRFAGMDAEEAIAHLAEGAVGAAKPVEDWRKGFTEATGTESRADSAYAQVVSLPMYPSLSQEEQHVVIGAVQAVCRRKGS